MKSKDVLNYILYNSVPHQIEGTANEWYEYHIPVAEGETVKLEAKVVEEPLDVMEFPKYSVRRMRHE